MPNKKDKTTNKKPSTKPDSITKVNIRLDGERGVVSFRCNKKLWFAFKKQIKAQGLSICHVLEPMIYGWLQSYVYISNTIRPLKIENVVIERAVRRVRRYAVEDLDDDGFVDEFVVWCVLKQSVFRDLKRLPCFLWNSCKCGNISCWEKVRPLILQLRGVS